jgi:hypothetical protein
LESVWDWAWSSTPCMPRGQCQFLVGCAMERCRGNSVRSPRSDMIFSIRGRGTTCHIRGTWRYHNGQPGLITCSLVGRRSRTLEIGHGDCSNYKMYWYSKGPPGDPDRDLRIYKGIVLSWSVLYMYLGIRREVCLDNGRHPSSVTVCAKDRRLVVSRYHFYLYLMRITTSIIRDPFIFRFALLLLQPSHNSRSYLLCGAVRMYKYLGQLQSSSGCQHKWRGATLDRQFSAQSCKACLVWAGKTFPYGQEFKLPQPQT